jgi:hypothetical protein
MHRNKCLLDTLNTARDFEAEESVLFQKFFVDRKNQVGMLVDYIDVSFRLRTEPFSQNTLIRLLDT